MSYPAHALRVLTLNTWGLAFTPDKSRRLQAIADHLAGGAYDLIGLQEVWEAEGLALLIRGAQAGGLAHYHHFPSGVSGSGLVIFSRYPITDVHFHRFRVAAASHTFWRLEQLGAKGVGMLRVQTPDGELDVYNTHAVAQYHPDSADENKSHRAAQMYEIYQFVRQHSRGNPFVFFGDFNTQPRHVGYRVMTQLVAAVDSYAALHPDDPGYTHSPHNPYNDKPDKHPERIDYVFVRDGHDRALTLLEAAVCMQTYQDIAYSDHYGVCVTLQMMPATPPDAGADDELAQAIFAEIRQGIRQGIEQAQQQRQERSRRMYLSLLGGAGLVLARGRLMGGPPRGMAAGLCFAYAFLNYVLAYFAMRAEVNALKAVLSEIERRH